MAVIRGCSSSEARSINFGANHNNTHTTAISIPSGSSSMSHMPNNIEWRVQLGDGGIDMGVRKDFGESTRIMISHGMHKRYLIPLWNANNYTTSIILLSSVPEVYLDLRRMKGT